MEEFRDLAERGYDLWLRYPCTLLTPETVIAHARRRETRRRFIDVVSKLENDDIDKWRIEFLAEGSERFGEAWDFVDNAQIGHAFAELVKPRSVLEIGVRRGFATAAIAGAWPEVELHLLDLWNDTYAGQPNPGPELVKRQLAAVGHQGRVFFYAGDSHDLLPQIAQRDSRISFDIVLVDGDHTLEGAQRDLEDAYPLVGPGGILIFDDIAHPMMPYLFDAWRQWQSAVRSQFRFAEFLGHGHGVGFAIRSYPWAQPALAYLPGNPRPGSKCPVCETNGGERWTPQSWRLSSEDSSFYYVRCLNCAALYCWPRPTSESLEDIHRRNPDYEWYERHRYLKSIHGWQRWKWLHRILLSHRVPNGKLLDIGCGHGMFIMRARLHGWEVAGIDYPSRGTFFAKSQLGLKIVEGGLAAAIDAGHLKHEDFDLVTMWHVLEHTTEPARTLASAVDLLKPGGKMLIAVPNGASEGMKIRQEEWVWCQPPYIHTVHFTPKGLSMLAEKSGLKQIAIWSRDTWDANAPYDIHCSKWISPLARKVQRKLSWKLGLCLEGGMRLACYAVDGVKQWVMGRESSQMDGSELVLLAERS